MAKKVILAKAGAGKTYYICHQINPNERNLILAYTHENVDNICRELKDAFQSIPCNTQVSTFHSFLYSHCILPYWPIIVASFNAHNKRLNGVTFKSPPPRIIKRKGKDIPNPAYISQTEIEHYLDSSDRIYCSYLSELLIQGFKRDKQLFSRIITRINMFFDNVLIDEFQDFRENDYSFIEKLAKKMNSIVMVGDYFQHSVSGSNNSGKPFKCKRADVSYENFCSALQKSHFQVDDTSLVYSRRCSLAVCDFVAEKLNIPILSSDINSGDIIWVQEDKIDQMLKDDKIIKLVWSESNKYNFNSINWSLSKGNTYNEICVILTEKFEKIGDTNFSLDGISQISINKLYVALTRSSGHVHLIKASSFKKVKDRYCRHNEI